jgi:hypothetical protein
MWWPSILSMAIANLSSWYTHKYCIFFIPCLDDVKWQWEGKECMKSHSSGLGSIFMLKGEYKYLLPFKMMQIFIKKNEIV